MRRVYRYNYTKTIFSRAISAKCNVYLLIVNQKGKRLDIVLLYLEADCFGLNCFWCKFMTEDLKQLTKVDLTNLDKILYPELKITKGQLIEYYIRMAPKMLPIMKDRPLVLTRYPDGIKGEKFGFFEKNAPLGTPKWVKTRNHLFFRLQTGCPLHRMQRFGHAYLACKFGNVGNSHALLND